MQEFTLYQISNMIDEKLWAEAKDYYRSLSSDSLNKRSRVVKTYGQGAKEVLELCRHRDDSDNVHQYDADSPQTSTLRYVSYPAYRDPDHSGYNMNCMFNSRIFLGQGPSGRANERDETNNSLTYDFERLMLHTVFHPAEEHAITTLMAIGQPIEDDKSKFYDYITPIRECSCIETDNALYEFELTSHDAPDLTQGIIHQYEFIVTRTDKKTQEAHAKRAKLYHVAKCEDMGVPQPKARDYPLLQAFYQREEKCLVHCSAGLGRGALMVLVGALLQHWGELCSLETIDEKVNLIYQIYCRFRAIRPGFIQNQPQLTAALKLCDDLYRLENGLELKARSNDVSHPQSYRRLLSGLCHSAPRLRKGAGTASLPRHEARQSSWCPATEPRTPEYLDEPISPPFMHVEQRCSAVAGSPIHSPTHAVSPRSQALAVGSDDEDLSKAFTPRYQ